MFRSIAFVIALIAATPVLAQSFEVAGVRFNKSAYLQQEKLQEIAKGIVNRPIVFADLEEMVAEIQGLYSESGILTARAILPPQEIRDGVLRVELVEATVSEVQVEGFERTKSEFVSRTISLEAGGLPDFELLEHDLRVYEISHDLVPLLSFAPGDATGTTVAIISAEEPKRFDWTVSVDNFGTEATGEYRGSLFGRWSSVTGWRDVLSMQLQASEGSYSGSLGYSRPVGPEGGRVIATASYTDSNIIEGVFEPVNILSNSITGSLSYRRPVRVRPYSHVIIEGGLAGEVSTSTIEGEDFSDVTLGEVVLQASYIRRFDTSLLSTTLGVKAGVSDAKDTSETEGEFYLAYMAADYTRSISDKALLDMSLTGQYAHRQNLPVARLFSVGGATSVRGYPNNIRGGDSGLAVKAQISPLRNYDLESMPDFSFSPFAFIDAAVVVPYRIDGSIDSEQDFLASIGTGVRVDWKGQASGLLMVALPQVDTLGFVAKDVTQVYFGLDYRF